MLAICLCLSSTHNTAIDRGPPPAFPPVPMPTRLPLLLVIPPTALPVLRYSLTCIFFSSLFHLQGLPGVSVSPLSQRGHCDLSLLSSLGRSELQRSHSGPGRSSVTWTHVRNAESRSPLFTYGIGDGAGGPGLCCIGTGPPGDFDRHWFENRCLCALHRI